MNNTFISKIMAGAIGMLLLTACGGGASDSASGGGSASAGGKTALGSGSAVIAEWGGNGNWYDGKITKACDGGFEVAWNDGSEPACVPQPGVVADSAPSALSVQVGAAVLAKQEGAFNFFSGKVTAVEGSTFTVETDGGLPARGITVSNLRLK